MPDYLQHGRRHAVGGSDPIPGLGGGGLSWAYISGPGSSVSCPATTNTRLPASASNFYTNATSTFDAHNSAGGVMGMRILASGHYLFWMSVGVGTPAPTTGDQYGLVVEGGGQFPDFSFAPNSMVFPGGLVANGELVNGGIMSVGGFISAPTDAIVCRIDNASTHDLHFIYTGLVVVQLDTTSADLN